MAGLPGRRAIVWVGPPLFASGPSSGLIGAALVPTRLPLTPALMPVMPLPSPMRLKAHGQCKGAGDITDCAVRHRVAGHDAVVDEGRGGVGRLAGLDE